MSHDTLDPASQAITAQANPTPANGACILVARSDALVVRQGREAPRLTATIRWPAPHSPLKGTFGVQSIGSEQA
jgi:hypothetical protein